MSTHAFVGNKADLHGINIIGSYIHSDGYPENVGLILQEHWNTKEKLDLLLSGGNLSSLGEKFAPESGEELNAFEDCIFYHRDRKEDFLQASIHFSPYLNKVLHAESKPFEFYYLFDEGVGYEVYDFSGKPLMILAFDQSYDYEGVMATRIGTLQPDSAPEGDVFW